MMRTMHRRHALAALSLPAFTLSACVRPVRPVRNVRAARAADVPRSGPGIASGQPRPHGMVLWTRLTGELLPDSVDVGWELAEDEAFQRIAARCTRTAPAPDAQVRRLDFAIASCQRYDVGHYAA